MQTSRSNFFVRVSIFLSIFTISFIDCNAQKRINFDEGWKFSFGHGANPDKDFNYSTALIFSKSGVAANTAIEAKFNDSSWKTVDLPHDWVAELPVKYHQSKHVEAHGYKTVGGHYPETSIGWYRKKFVVANADLGQRFQIQFDGIFRNAAIWVNGFFVGNNMSGYIGASYDITDVINYGKENVVVVKVDATQYEGWFYEGAGIYRHVWLNQSNVINIPADGMFIHASVQDKKATVAIETAVENKHLAPVNCTVYSYVETRDGKMIGQSKKQPLFIAINARGVIKQNIVVNNPRLWNLDDPYLYRVVSVVSLENQIVSTKTERLGIRTLRFDAKEGFFLNGKYLKIQGTNNHQDHAGIGSALPDYINYYRIALLKEMGCNAYRSSHNPPTPELLDACDSLGMLVLDETRLLNSSAEYMSQFERLILRDRNHPSVFIWSIGNEEDLIQAEPNSKRIAQTLIAKQKELDPYRISTYAANLGNVFKGVNEVIPVRGFNYHHFAVADYHKDHPNQPILATEMGSTVTTRGIYETDSISAYLPDQDITAPPWATTAETWWKLAAENKFWLGGFIWTGFDYRGEPTPFSWPNINSHFGVMDVCGFPKNIYYYYQSWWTDKDVLKISPHWNWPDKVGQEIDVWVNSNADNVELFLNGKSQGKKDMMRNSHLIWKVKYEPGKLEAIAYKKGKKITAIVETTFQPAQVKITASKNTMFADGQDATVINVSVIDNEGREVPYANNMIQFTISGPGKIIGVGNGDPSSHEPDKCTDGAWQRNAFNGKCQLIILSGKSPGVIKVEAKAEGLIKAVTDLTLLPVDSNNDGSTDKKY